MAQVLQLSKSDKMTVDRTFVDGGKKARFALIGGNTVLIAEGSPQQPMIHQLGKQYFYQDGAAVTNPAHIQHLPEPYRAQALAFIETLTKRPGTAAKLSAASARRPLRAGRGAAGAKRASAKVSGQKKIEFDPAQAIGVAAKRPVSQAELGRRKFSAEDEV